MPLGTKSKSAQHAQAHAKPSARPAQYNEFSNPNLDMQGRHPAAPASALPEPEAQIEPLVLKNHTHQSFAICRRQYLVWHIRRLDLVKRVRGAPRCLCLPVGSTTRSSLLTKSTWLILPQNDKMCLISVRSLSIGQGYEVLNSSAEHFCCRSRSFHYQSLPEATQLTQDAPSSYSMPSIRTSHPKTLSSQLPPTKSETLSVV